MVDGRRRLIGFFRPLDIIMWYTQIMPKTNTIEFDTTIAGIDILIRFDRATTWVRERDDANYLVWGIDEDVPENIEVETFNSTIPLAELTDGTRMLVLAAVETYMADTPPDMDEGSDEPDWDAINDERREREYDRD